MTRAPAPVEWIRGERREVLPFFALSLLALLTYSTVVWFFATEWAPALSPEQINLWGTVAGPPFMIVFVLHLWYSEWFPQPIPMLGVSPQGLTFTSGFRSRTVPWTRVFVQNDRLYVLPPKRGPVVTYRLSPLQRFRLASLAPRGGFVEAGLAPGALPRSRLGTATEGASTGTWESRTG